MEITFELILICFLVASIAGFVDTLAGGGGLICIPALIMMGVPPLFALGTNKFQSSVGTLTATYILLKHKRIKWSTTRPLFIMAFMGSVVGTALVQFIDTEILSFVIPAVLGIICLYFLLAPAPQPTDKPVMSNATYRNTVVPGIGMYDGLFGPGTGSFFTLAGVSLNGLALVKATAQAKPLNFATNIASVLVFFIAGKILWAVGFAMLFGQILGAWLGAHSLYRIKPQWLRVLIVVMCASMLMKYGHSMGWFTF